MDHLLYPSSTNIPPLQIPFLCDGEEEYDNRGFTTYSLRKVWANSATSLEWLQCSDEDLAKRAQLWLYFGLLSEFCGRVVLRSALRRVNEVTASPELSTVNLLGLIDNRKRRRSKENLEKTRRLLEEALRLSELVEIRITSTLGSLHLISCSVRALLQTLNSAQGLQIQALSSVRRYQAGRRWPLRFSAGLFDEWKISPAKAIKYRMADLGWCPAQINDFSRKYSCIMLYYISGLAMENGVNHAQCTITACTAYNIDESCYVPRHTESCCGHICSFVEATSASVASIISDNYGIPLVSCSMSTDGTIRTEIVRAEPNLEYFAISHVWSGGLGNPTSNVLPKCQINKLMHRIQCLRGRLSHSFGIGDRLSPENPTLFWIDTLCIPLGQSFRSARRKAIDSMAEIYSGATAVLVLDPELQHLRYENLKPEQALAHVLCSSWMSRCWTLQEASLSSSWLVQFEDSAIDVSRTMKQLCMKAKMDFWIARGSLKPSMRRALVEELSNFLIEMGEVRYQRRGRYSRSEIWNLKQLELHQAISFATTWNNFLGRTTSKTEDLHQIWAGMEDINMAGVRALAIEDRMKAILKCHAALPIDLLFCPCERMRDVNLANTWAPRFPQGQRLDGMSGSMKVFTNYLFIPAEVTSKHLQLYLVASKGFSAPKFQLDIPKAGSVWIETDMTDPPDPHQHKDIDDSITCLMFQVMDYQPHGHIWSEEVGARFLLRKKLGHDVYLTYDRPFRMYRYNRGSVTSSNEALLPSTYPCVSAELVEPASRVFIDCALESWPTAPLVYDSIEGPTFSKPAPYILFFLNTVIHLTWTLSIIITMAAAPQFEIARLPVFYCFLVKSLFAYAEIFWYKGVWEEIEREVWSLNAACNRSHISIYDVINRHPSLLFGFKRGAVTLCASIGFLCFGSIRRRISWALWFGALLLFEFILRSIICFCWFTLPRTPQIQARVKDSNLFPRFYARLMHLREPLLQTHDRRPFEEEIASPFKETWPSVWGSYMRFFKGLFSTK